jgi:ribonuclease HII
MTLYEFDRSVERELDGCVVGIDEAGRGPLAGPVVAAAVRLDLSNPIPGVTDSQKLSAQKRERIYALITEQSPAWAVGSASPEEIDRLNILQASLLAMKRALDRLTVSWKLVLVDGNTPLRSLATEQQRPLVGGDAISASVAAASIIAKVTRDRLMQEYHTAYPEYGFDANKGYPTEKHRKRVMEQGLSPIHRKSFCEKIVTQTELQLLY